MLHVDPTFLLLNNSNASPLKFQEHREEVDHYIKSQNENFRMLLQEQREQHMMELLKKMESEALYELNQKDEQIAQAAKKKLELEEFMRRLEAENQSWRIVAQKNEAMAMSLHNTLEQIKERVSYGTIVEDAESCYDGNRLVKEESEENKLCNDGDAKEV
ncbi:hypothetical protein RJT34_08107 [Clitoria ternatea]|uniref:BOI-related E3 ubiquitin-protein ligase 3 n=1 Tax=Clitoria ternatea TaxID=43366 RepID=A0AAN9K3D0_CLITE